MTSEPRFVTRIEKEIDDKRVFCGTGFLVSPRHVLTCAHVILTTNPISALRWTWDDDIAHPAAVNVFVKFADVPNSENYRGTAIAYGKPDVALIELDREVQREPVRLIACIGPHHLSAIKPGHVLVTGYSSPDPSGVTTSSMGTIVGWSQGSLSERLMDLQFDGGLAARMSGSPALVDIAGEWACLGMAYLGGERAATSRLIPGDVLLDVLKGCPAVFPSPWEAEDCFPRTLATFLGMQLNQQRLSRHDLASSLEIHESVVEYWENGGSTPALEYRPKLILSLARGDTRVKEELQQLLHSADAARPPEDIVERLGVFAVDGRLTLRRVDRPAPWRSLGVEEPRPRVYLKLDARAKIFVDVPWEGYATLLDVQRLESAQCSYSCIDPVLRFSGQLRAGRTVLPAGRATLRVGRPLGRCCLIALARKSAPFSWTRENTAKPSSVSHETLLREVELLLQSNPDDFLVALCEYEVTERDV